MNKLLVNALGSSSAQAICAAALTQIPRAARLLPLAKPPAQRAFADFVDALLAADPHAPTRCAGWTVHELTAHLAAGSAEIADLVELELVHGRTRPTRGFEEREEPYRACPPETLRRRFFREALRATVAVERLSGIDTARRIVFTGAALDAADVITHIESELIIHRWDIVGADQTGILALSDPRLGAHAATIVAAMTPNVFPPRSGEGQTVILRSPGCTDIAVTGGGVTAIALCADDSGQPIVTCHPAVRNLLLWGRTPDADLPAPTGDPRAIAAVTAMLRPHES